MKYLYISLGKLKLNENEYNEENMNKIIKSYINTCIKIIIITGKKD